MSKDNWKEFDDIEDVEQDIIVRVTFKTTVSDYENAIDDIPSYGEILKQEIKFED